MQLKDKMTKRPRREFNIVMSGQFCTLAMFGALRTFSILANIPCDQFVFFVHAHSLVGLIVVTNM